MGLTGHRNQARDVEVQGWKVRVQWVGSVGSTKLAYDVPTGRYSEPRYDMRMPAPVKPYHEVEDDDPF